VAIAQCEGAYLAPSSSCAFLDIGLRICIYDSVVLDFVNCTQTANDLWGDFDVRGSIFYTVFLISIKVHVFAMVRTGLERCAIRVHQSSTVQRVFQL